LAAVKGSFLAMIRIWLSVLVVACVVAAESQTAFAQETQLDGELQRLQGHWRVVELIENGQTVPDDQLRSMLPGGGLLEIVDTTMLFKSPVDGHKSTKSFRIDASSYPKKIAVYDLDRMTGQGVFQHDGGKLVIVVSAPPNAVPTDFSAPAGSNRTMLVLVPYNQSETESRRLDLGPPPSVARRADSDPSFRNPTPFPEPIPQPIPQASPQPIPRPDQSAAGRILTDDEVSSMLVGKWRMNDGSGLIDITIDARRVFSSYRHAQMIQTFHQVFVPTPVSSGTWTVKNGQLFLNVTSSWRSDLVNHTIVFAVRSISPNDAIVVDNLGRVAKAERLP
jgi:uncharacterized protein (TIGR03067 family)